MISIKHINYLNQIGRRAQLEDSIYPKPGDATPEDKLFLVCDGVGGENLGEEASRIVCEEFAAYFKEHPIQGAELTEAYIDKAQQQVLAAMGYYASAHPDAAKMSTTLTLAYFEEQAVTVAWCGDSRVYHLRNGEVLWRSTDHSLVGMLVKQGEITEEEAATHPQRNVIMRSLSAAGSPQDIDVHRITDLRDGDHILLCTDGLLEQINQERLKNLLQIDREDKESLFMAYCEGKTKDNFSMYLLKIDNDKPAGAAKPTKSAMYAALALVVALIFAGLIFMWWGKQETGQRIPQKHNATVVKANPQDTVKAIKRSPIQHKVASKPANRPVKKANSAPMQADADTSGLSLDFEVGYSHNGFHLKIGRNNGQQPQNNDKGAGKGKPESVEIKPKLKTKPETPEKDNNPPRTDTATGIPLNKLISGAIISPFKF